MSVQETFNSTSNNAEIVTNDLMVFAANLIYSISLKTRWISYNEMDGDARSDYVSTYVVCAVN